MISFISAVLFMIWIFLCVYLFCKDKKWNKFSFCGFISSALILIIPVVLLVMFLS